MSNSDKLYDFIIYHKQCNDGFASAWIAWRYLKDKVSNIQYHDAQPNDKTIPDINGKSVLMVDVTFIDKNLMDQVRNKSKKLFIIDHHDQAHSVIKPTDKVIHEKTHSAAYLTWKYFFPSENVPIVVKLIEDGDLKSQKFEYTRYLTTPLKLKYKLNTSEFEK